MSETLIFIIGSGVFAVTTGATLLFGYLSFNRRAEEQGIGIGPDSDLDGTGRG